MTFKGIECKVCNEGFEVLKYYQHFLIHKLFLLNLDQHFNLTFGFECKKCNWTLQYNFGESKIGDKKKRVIKHMSSCHKINIPETKRITYLRE